MKILTLIVSILIPIVLGFFFKIIKLFNQQENATLRKFVVKVSVPFIIFRNLYNADYNVLNQIVPLILALFLLTFLFLITSLLLSKLVKKSHEEENSLILASTFGNYGYLGWGIMFYFYGNPGLTRSVFFTMFFWPVFLTFGFLFIYFSEKSNFSKEIFIKTLLKNASVPIISAFLGLIFKLYNIPIPELINNTINTFANFTIPLILFTIGLSLNFKLNLKKIKLISLSSSIRLIFGFFLGLITIFILSLFTKLDLLSKKIILMEAIMPTATMTPFFIDYLNSDEELISAIITFSTIFSLISIPIWYFFVEKIF